MKVYIPAIEGFMPSEMVYTLCAFLEFCYIVHHHVIPESALGQIESALVQFHHHCRIFAEGNNPITSTFSLPWQHAAKHYPHLIYLFSAPNGLCSFMTKNKHIKAIKEPWCQSNKYQPLSQMLLINQWLDKIAATCVDFKARNISVYNSGTYPLLSTFICLAQSASMCENTCSKNDRTNDTEVPCTASIIGDNDVSVLENAATDLSIHVRLAQNPYDPHNAFEIPLSECPWFNGSIHVFNSACLRFYAPSNLSGIGKMQMEFIWSMLWWRNEGPQKDCVFVTTNLGDQESSGMQAFDIAYVHAFFLFTDTSGIHYPCAVVHWFNKVDDSPDEDTRMWIIQPSYLHNHTLNFAIIHIDAIYRAAHLIPIYDTSHISQHIKPHNSYDTFCAFYVNKYVDHHAFELAS
ncbi:hypothetical protein J3R82DRAFT_109 [Butyriboletus roseoflavus]|nr:hypothetical protein J3R82DRAFT_109 [Butyriboletus roseoflavus]